MIQEVEHPVFSYRDLSSARKKPGLSAIVRVQNEGEFLRAALDSIAPFFDEIVIVVGNSADDTTGIAADFAASHAEQVKAYHYVPETFPLGSRKHLATPGGSVHSFVYYCNFALSKASYQIRCNWDGDQIADPRALGCVVERLRGLRPGSIEWWSSPWRFGYWWFIGLNLWNQNDELYVPMSRPFAGPFHDLGFYPAARWVRFKRFPRGEYVFKRLLWHQYVGCILYHLKGMKQNRGIDNYQLADNPDSLFKPYLARTWTNPPLLKVQEFRAQDARAGELQPPEALGIPALVARQP